MEPTVKRRISLPALILNVPGIARKSASQVAQLLGPPDPVGAPSPGHQPTHSYRGGTVQVVYVDGKAAWIRLYNLRNADFSPEILPKLGLPARKPTHVSAGHAIGWSNLPNLREVSLYRDQRAGVSWLLICVQAGSPSPARPERRSGGWSSLRELLSA
jgi:hypothetical protein